MSIASEKTRIENARNRIRNCLVSLGIASGTETIEELAALVEQFMTGGSNELSYLLLSAPAKTVYFRGETLDLSDVKATALYNGNDVTNSVTFSPPNNSLLNNVGTQNIIATYTENGITMVQNQSITVLSPIPSWETGTDSEIVDALHAHYNGHINIHDYWHVGDKRTVHLSPMNETDVGESHVEQDVVMVLVNSGGKWLSNGQECAFIVSMEDCLKEGGYMNQTATNAGGWKNSKRRSWCNDIYRNSIPSSLRDIFKMHINKTSRGSSLSLFDETEDYFALPTEYNLLGTLRYSVSGEDDVQWTYYQTETKRIKRVNSTPSFWWERSPNRFNSDNFCAINREGYGQDSNANLPLGISPFGCI